MHSLNNKLSCAFIYSLIRIGKRIESSVKSALEEQNLQAELQKKNKEMEKQGIKNREQLRNQILTKRREDAMKVQHDKKELTKQLLKEQEKDLRLKQLKKEKIRKMEEEAKPDYIDIDKDGDEEESMKDAAEDAKDDNETNEGDDMNHSYHTPEDDVVDLDILNMDSLEESFNKRMRGNLHGSEYILRETFRG